MKPDRAIPLFHVCLLLACLLVPASAIGGLNTHQLNNLGVEAYEAGETEKAVDYLRRATRSQPYDQQLRNNFANALLKHGHQLLQDHHYEEAASLFLEGQDVAPDNQRFWLYRAHALLALKAFSEAEVEVNEALGINPESASSWLLLGQIYYATGRLQAAVDAWREALQRSPDDTQLAAKLNKAERELKVEQGMTSSYAANFVISYDGDRHADLGPDLLEVLDEAYVDVGTNFDFYPQGQVPVLVYTREDFSRITSSPGWAAGLYDGKIRIPLGGVKKISPHLRALLYHEYTHVVVRELSRGQCPTWLNEGLAETVARSQFDPPFQQFGKTDKLSSFTELNGSWQGLPVEKVRLAYEQSYSFVRYLIDYYGWHAISDLLSGFSEESSAEVVFEKVFNSYGLDLVSLQGEWRQTLGED